MPRQTSRASEPDRGTGPRPPAGGRFPGVDGLRALAALSILVVHVWLEASPSGPPSFGARLDERMLDLSYGVTLFFTISGFLLYRPFCAVLLRGEGVLRVRSYLRHRAFRILPAYWVVLLTCGLVVGGLLHREEGRLVVDRLTDPGLLARAALLVQDYDPQTLLTGIGPAWTLAVEAVFYLVLPLLAGLAWRSGRGRSGPGRVLLALAPPALLLLVGATGKVVAGVLVPSPLIIQGWESDWHSVLERSFWCQADLFSGGMALAVLHGLQQDGRLRLPQRWRVVAGLGAVGGYLLCAKVAPYGSQLTYSPWNTLMALACTCLLALVVLGPPAASRLVRVLRTRPLVLAGTVSYSIFLWHHPLVLSARQHHLTQTGHAGLVLDLVLILALTLGLSTLTYRWVELPAQRVARRRRVATTTMAPVTVEPGRDAAGPAPDRPPVGGEA